MVVNTKVDRQHVIAFALLLPSTWAKKVDYYNLGVHMARNVRCRLSVGLWGMEVISASKRPV